MDQGGFSIPWKDLVTVVKSKLWAEMTAMTKCFWSMCLEFYHDDYYSISWYLDDMSCNWLTRYVLTHLSFARGKKHCATWGCNMLLNGAKKHQRTTDEVFWDYLEACLPMTMVSICSWGSPNWYPKTNPCSWAHFKLSWPVSTNWIKLTGHLLTQFNPAIMKIAQLAVVSF